MRVVYGRKWDKIYKKRIKSNQKLHEKFKERIKLFEKDPGNPMLKLHPLKGSRTGLFAFSVTGDVRAILVIEEDTAILVDIGTHAQVY